MKQTLSPEQLHDFTWEDLKDVLYEKYIPDCYRHNRQNEFWNLRQGKKTIAEYDRVFNQLSRYAPDLVSTNVAKADKFRKGLRPEITVPLASHGLLTFAQTLSHAMNIESMLPREREKTPEQPQPFNPNVGKRKWEGNNYGNQGGASHGEESPNMPLNTAYSRNNQGSIEGHPTA